MFKKIKKVLYLKSMRNVKIKNQNYLILVLKITYNYKKIIKMTNKMLNKRIL